MVRARGIEPRPQAWEAHVLPIYYARKEFTSYCSAYIAQAREFLCFDLPLLDDDP
jgi:hypothetical protein